MSANTEPYSTIKCKLKKIILNDKCESSIEEFVYKGTEIDFQTKLFIRTYVIYCFENDIILPVIDAKFYYICALILMVKSQSSGKQNNETKIIYDKLLKFYDNKYSKLGYDKNEINSLHMTRIISYFGINYQTDFNNNITIHFESRINSLVNGVFIENTNKSTTNYETFDKIKKSYCNKKFILIKSTLDIIQHILKTKFFPLRMHGKINTKDDDDKKLYRELCNKKHKLLSQYNETKKYLKIQDDKINTTINIKSENIIINIDSNLKIIKELDNKFYDDIKLLPKKINIKYINTKELKLKLQKVKKDLLNGTNTADDEYKDWIIKTRKKIIPKFDENKYTLHEYLNLHPQEFLKCMYNMLKILENKKLFQLTPTSTSIIPRYIKIDTKFLVEVFCDGHKGEYLKNININKDKIWNKFLNLKSNIFTNISKSYKFDYSILTDGYSASIQCISNSESKIKSKKHINLSKKRKENKEFEEMCENEDEIDKLKNDRKLKIEKDKNDKMLKKKDQIKIKKEEFKKLSKEQQNKIREMMKRKNTEFLYIDDLNEKELKDVMGKFYSKVVVNDPGKRYLLHMLNNCKKEMTYSNKEHLKNTKRIEINEKLQKYRDNNGISEKEKYLCDYNSKSVNFETFSEYVKAKNKVNNELKEKYKAKIFRQQKWYGYINRQRTDEKIIKKISDTYGKDITIFFGDWSIGKQMKNFISTPNIRLKRLIAKHFLTYNLDEFRTSKLKSGTLKECENLSLPDKFGVSRELHSILTYKREFYDIESNTLKTFKSQINRDKNAKQNMLYSVEHYLNNKTFPIEFMRKGEITKIVLDEILDNLIKLENVSIKNEKIETLEKIIDKYGSYLLQLIKKSLTEKKDIIKNKLYSDEINSILNDVTNGLKNNTLDVKYSNMRQLKNLYNKQKKLPTFGSNGNMPQGSEVLFAFN